MNFYLIEIYWIILRLFKIIVLLSNEIGVLQLMEEITENTKYGIRIDQIIW